MAEQGPKMLNTANRKLAWVPTIEDPSAPSATDLNGGVELSCLVTAADYQFGITGNEQITDPALCDDIEAGVPGRATVEAGMMFFRFKSDDEDTGWTTFTGKGLSGYLVERVGQMEEGERPEETEFKSGDEVQILKAITNDPQTQSPSTAGFEKFKQDFAPQRHWPRSIVAA